MDINILKELIAATYNVDDFFDFLGWDMYDIVDALEDEIKNNSEEFSKEFENE